MKFLRLLTISLVIGMLSLNAQAQTGPALWTSYIDVLGNYFRVRTEGNVVSRFTPGTPIFVTRVQLQAAQGSYLFPQGKCQPLPKIKVTDGTTSYMLAIPNARSSGGFPVSVSADSGPIYLSYPQNAKIRLTVVPGETGCSGGAINVTIQYVIY
jgi:hypothetical protein